jgi:hypothetical protein
MRQVGDWEPVEVTPHYDLAKSVIQQRLVPGQVALFGQVH